MGTQYEICAKTNFIWFSTYWKFNKRHISDNTFSSVYDPQNIAKATVAINSHFSICHWNLLLDYLWTLHTAFSLAFSLSHFFSKSLRYHRSKKCSSQHIQWTKDKILTINDWRSARSAGFFFKLKTTRKRLRKMNFSWNELCCHLWTEQKCKISLQRQLVCVRACVCLRISVCKCVCVRAHISVCASKCLHKREYK